MTATMTMVDMVGSVMPTPKDVPILAVRTCTAYITFPGKRDVADNAEVKDFEVGRLLWFI